MLAPNDRAMLDDIKHLARTLTVTQIAKRTGLRPGQVSALCLANGITIGVEDFAPWSRFEGVPILLPWFDGDTGRNLVREAERRKIMPEQLAMSVLMNAVRQGVHLQ
jgi:hypothetical protein